MSHDGAFFIPPPPSHPPSILIALKMCIACSVHLLQFYYENVTIFSKATEAPYGRHATVGQSFGIGIEKLANAIGRTITSIAIHFGRGPLGKFQKARSIVLKTDDDGTRIETAGLCVRGLAGSALYVLHFFMRSIYNN